MTQATPPADREPTNPFFVWWAKVMVRHRLLVSVLVLASTAAMAWPIFDRLEVDTSVEAFVATDSESQRVLEEFRTEFGRDDAFLVLVRGDVFTLPFLDRLRALHQELVVVP